MSNAGQDPVFNLHAVSDTRYHSLRSRSMVPNNSLKNNRSQSRHCENNGSGRAADTGTVRSQEKKVYQDDAITLPEKLTH